MLSPLRLSWKVILENHFPSLVGSSFCVSTSRPCALYFQLPSSCPPVPLPLPVRLGFIRAESLRLRASDGCGGLGWGCVSMRLW